MGRPKGVLNRRTVELIERIAALPEKERNARGVASALGMSYVTAWRLLRVSRESGVVPRARHLSVHQRAHRTNVIHQRDTLPSDSLTEDELRIARNLGISPGRAAWLLTCPRDARVSSRKAIGWRGGNAIG